jgi:hypothetical protein
MIPFPSLPISKFPFSFYPLDFTRFIVYFFLQSSTCSPSLSSSFSSPPLPTRLHARPPRIQRLPVPTSPPCPAQRALCVSVATASRCSAETGFRAVSTSPQVRCATGLPAIRPSGVTGPRSLEGSLHRRNSVRSKRPWALTSLEC